MGAAKQSVTCIETGRKFTDPDEAYKAALNIFHLPDQGPTKLLRDLENHSNQEYARRASHLLAFASEGGV